MDQPTPSRDTQPLQAQSSAPAGAEDARHERLGLYVLAALVLSFSVLGVYGIIYDDGPLEVLAFCGAMPTLFGFLLLLGMHMMWFD